MTQRIVVVSAGLSVPSSTKLLADKLGDAVERAVVARGREVDVQHVELRPLAHALADHLLTGFATGELAKALDLVRAADAVVVVTPVFSASYSGLFKTFFDVLEPGALDGTPVVIAATAGTARHSLVLDHALRPLFAYLRAVVVVTPVFSASYSGLFKTFFDVLEPGALDGTPVVIAATAGTARHSLVLDHALRPLFAYLRAVVVPTGVFAASEDFGASDDGSLDKRVQRAAGELAVLLGGATAAAPAPARRSVADEVAAPTPFEQLLREAGGSSVR